MFPIIQNWILLVLDQFALLSQHHKKSELNLLYTLTKEIKTYLGRNLNIGFMLCFFLLFLFWVFSKHWESWWRKYYPSLTRQHIMETMIGRKHNITLFYTVVWKGIYDHICLLIEYICVYNCYRNMWSSHIITKYIVRMLNTMVWLIEGKYDL